MVRPLESDLSRRLRSLCLWAITVDVARGRLLQSKLCLVSCSSHGTCRQGSCLCVAGWSGRDCTYFLADGSSDADDSLDVDACVDGCSAHGTCNSGVCHCSAGWGGVSCSTAVECPKACRQPNGLCKGGTCVCAAGFFGPQCADSSCPSKCFGHGSCNKGVCECAQDWFGHLCDSYLPGDETRPDLSQAGDAQPQDTEKGVTKPFGDAMVQVKTGSGFTASKPLASLPCDATLVSLSQPKIQANLEAVRHATYAAGMAADLLRQTAQKEFAESAKHRVEAAIVDAHKHVERIPGYQDLASIKVPSRERSADTQPPCGKTASMAITLPVHSTTTLKCEADCSGHGACVTQGTGTACKCSTGWVGMLCDMQRCENDCNGRGVCVQGHCLCGKGWLGSSCMQQRCPDDCSGLGFCFSGKCRCKTGYEGANCAKVKLAGISISVKMQPLALMNARPPTAPHIEGMTLRAIPSESCPDDCNGHGTCGEHGACACNVGYSGLACDLSCPSECSHNGDCIEGACLCFAGFLGVDCSVSGCCSGHGSCDDPGTCACNSGWSGDDCSLKLMCPDTSCSGHGTCTGGKCHCEPGFLGPSCAIADGGCEPLCGPTGACNLISHKCECAAGFAGVSCLEVIQSCPKNCNNRGLCMDGTCMCGSGWRGHDCGERYFQPGQKPPSVGASEMDGGDTGSGVGGGSLPSEVAPTSARTLGHDEDGFSGVVKTNGEGPKVNGAAHGVQMLVLTKASGGMVCGEGGLCSGHGKCNTELAQCECATDFFGEVCEQRHCAGFIQGGQECSGHGYCELGQCHCAPGWGMALSTLTGTKTPQACMDRICQAGCGEHGKCIDGACVCQQGWQGVNCKDPWCSNDCAGHGQCVFQSPHSPGQCLCDSGWGGAACQRLAMYAQLKKCPNDCSGKGLCMDGVCACNVGLKGPDCTDIQCSDAFTGPRCDRPRCHNDCHGRGLCMSGTCLCWASYVGKDCKIPVVCQESCRHICETSEEDEKCNACIGVCESSSSSLNLALGDGGLGSHNPFEDLQSSL